MPHTDDYKPAFENAVRAMKGLARKLDYPVWPRILADDRADDVVAHARKHRAWELR